MTVCRQGRITPFLHLFSGMTSFRLCSEATGEQNCTVKGLEMELLVQSFYSLTWLPNTIPTPSFCGLALPPLHPSTFLENLVHILCECYGACESYVVLVISIVNYAPLHVGVSPLHCPLLRQTLVWSPSSAWSPSSINPLLQT